MAQPTAQAKSVDLPYLSHPAQIRTYDNGYTFVFIPKKGDVFNISTWVRTGSIHENEEINGISHFLEHLLFKGTERYKPGEFDQKMESMGAVINAATWKDFTFYYVTGPKGFSDAQGRFENFETALDMHADMMICSTIPVEEVGPQYDPFDSSYQGEKRERSVVIEEIGMREDQPWTKVYNSVTRMMYPEGHPYRRDVIGTRQIIGQIPQETIVNYYKQWYSPANMTTIVVGDFEPDALESKVLTHFDFTKMSVSTAKPITSFEASSVSSDDTKERYEEIKGDYQTTFLIIGYHGPSPKQLKETIALDIMNQVLGESRNSRLTQALIEKPEKPLFNMIGSGQSTYKLGNAFYIQGNCNVESAQQAADLVLAEVDLLLNEQPISDEEFQRAVKKLKVVFAETSETSSGIAETVGEYLTVTDGLSQYIDYLPTLLQMDCQYVQSVAQRYLSREKAYISILSPNQK